MAQTAQCEHQECPEFEVPKNMEFLPPDYTDPVYCGACGNVIDISDLQPEPEVTPHG